MGALKTAVKGVFLAGFGLAMLALYLAGFNEILLLIGGGLLVMLVRNFRRFGGNGIVAALVPLTSLTPLVAVSMQTATPVSLIQLFWIFLKIGAVLYGSGYVLLAFLQNDLVNRTGWLTNQQLLDAVAVGQFTPGPVFTTATFIGFVVAGWPGAVLATVGIFLPSFFFVAASNPLIPRLRASPWMGAFLVGVNVASLSLMAGVTWTIGRAAIVDWLTAVLAVVATVLLIRFKVNSAWLVLGGGIVGLLFYLLR